MLGGLRSPLLDSVKPLKPLTVRHLPRDRKDYATLGLFRVHRDH